jgi:hypothetical protein
LVCGIGLSLARLGNPSAINDPQIDYVVKEGMTPCC